VVSPAPEANPIVIALIIFAVIFALVGLWPVALLMIVVALLLA
jgi:hypothetical protein